MKNYTLKQIEADFEYLKEKLIKIHPNPFFFLSKENFEIDMNNLASSLEDLDDMTFFFRIMEIFSKMKDSHTRVKGVGKILSKEKYPIRFKYLDNQYYISSIDDKYKEYVGSKIQHINNFTIKDVVSKMAKVITHENEVVLSNSIEQWMYEPDILKYLGIVDDSLILNIQTENKTFTIYPTEISEEELYNPRKENLPKSETLNPKGLYWTKYIENLSTYYLQYNECEDIKEEEVQRIIDEIKEKDAKYVVVDLRNNIGGSSLILDPLTNFLYKNQDKYIPIVLLSNLTYSAAIINALNILDCKNSISIGTKTSGSPTKYGETTTITLPNTQMDVVISTKYFEEEGYEYGQPLVPRIQTVQTIEQYLNAIDVDWEEFLIQRSLLK